ncbi:MAG: hypothetical protein AB7O80_11020 [Acetobacteraceae bacterium]
MAIALTAWGPGSVSTPGATWGVAFAEEMTWRIRNTYDYQVRVAFYSVLYRRVWPGAGQGFLLDNAQERSFTLACARGERICYGAWPLEGGSGPHWGIGKNRTHRCRTCCGICGKDNPIRELQNE